MINTEFSFWGGALTYLLATVVGGQNIFVLHHQNRG